jgi:hypothetical protein
VGGDGLDGRRQARVPGSGDLPPAGDHGLGPLGLAGRERGPGEDDQHVADPVGGDGPPGEALEQGIAHGGGPLRLAGRGQHLDQYLVGVVGHWRPGGQPPCPDCCCFGAHEGTRSHGAASRLDQHPGGSEVLAGLLGDVGRQLAPPLRQAGVRPFDRRQGPSGQLTSFRSEELRQHRLTRQCVPEPEPLPVGLDQLGVHGRPQRFDHRPPVDPEQPGEQLPVEAASQQCRSPEHGSTGAVQQGQALPHRLGEVERHRGHQSAGGPPFAVIRPDRT